MAAALLYARGSYRVWQRNRDVYLSLWRSEFVASVVEPIIILLAMGYGLGSIIGEVEGRRYIEFIAPGVLSTYVMFGAVFECSWGTFVRMQIQRTFDAIIVTPISIHEVITGELFWGVTRSFIAGCVMLMAISIAGWVDSPLAALLPVAIVLEGAMCASFSLAYTALVSKVSSFNYFYNLLITPMVFFSGVFFPLSGLPEGARYIAWALPLTHMAELNRALVTGETGWTVLWSTLYIVALTATLFPLSLYLMKRRLVK